MAVSFDIDAESRRLDSEKPYFELIDGIEVQKMSPLMRHAQIGAELAHLIVVWAKTQRGVAVTEARFWLDVNPKSATSLLPDVAFVSADRLANLSDRDRQRPPFAPDLAIESLLFWLEGPTRFSASARTELSNTTNRVYVSAVSAFEISVKVKLKRLTLPDSPGRFLPPFFERSGLKYLAVSIEHGFGVFDLPLHHNDPFDRLLIAQARIENLTLVTSNRQFRDYEVDLLLL